MLAAILGPIFWVLILTPILWIVRRFFPKWEKVLFMKIPKD